MPYALPIALGVVAALAVGLVLVEVVPKILDDLERERERRRRLLVPVRAAQATEENQARASGVEMRSLEPQERWNFEVRKRSAGGKRSRNNSTQDEDRHLSPTFGSSSSTARTRSLLDGDNDESQHVLGDIRSTDVEDNRSRNVLRQYELRPQNEDAFFTASSSPSGSPSRSRSRSPTLPALDPVPAPCFSFSSVETTPDLARPLSSSASSTTSSDSLTSSVVLDPFGDHALELSHHAGRGLGLPLSPFEEVEHKSSPAATGVLFDRDALSSAASHAGDEPDHEHAGARSPALSVTASEGEWTRLSDESDAGSEGGYGGIASDEDEWAKVRTPVACRSQWALASATH
ncbi:hypothetical protein JCM8097_006673 [Rhodosporidiobolus ruineniae]